MIKEMTGLEALDYLNEKRGERSVEGVALLPGRRFRLSHDGSLQFRDDFLTNEWYDERASIGWFLSQTYTSCEDPSKPVESDYEKDKKDIEAFFANISLVNFIEKYYVRKEKN